MKKFFRNLILRIRYPNCFKKEKIFYAVDGQGNTFVITSQGVFRKRKPDEEIQFRDGTLLRK